MKPEKTLHQLILGNQRFVEGLSLRSAQGTIEKRVKLARDGQKPIATVLTCSDSRLPVEMIFDADIGDLFVVRNAGNMVSNSVLASMELAILNFGVDLCLVLGHTQCGAVESAIHYHKTQESPTKHIKHLIQSIMPHVDRPAPEPKDLNSPQYLNKVIRRNILSSCEKIIDGSTLLRTQRDKGQLHIVGGIYNIKTGVVSFDLQPLIE